MKRLIISVLAILSILLIFNSTNAAQEATYHPVETIDIEEEKRKLLLQEVGKYVEDETPLIVNGITVVNKDYNLPENYTPDLEEEMKAMEAYEDMKRAAKEEGIIINIRSGYRSYKVQSSLYNQYVKRDGEQAASRYSAKPGHSEHQLGTAFDFTTSDTITSIGKWFDDTPQAKWLYENAYKYGFILRYPKGKENITGYMSESWHYRYIGTEHSKNFEINDLTLEEYLGLDNI